MNKTEDPVREELLAIATEQEQLRERLAALVVRRLTPAHPAATDEDLPEQVDLATERRSVIECILHDLLPVIDDLREAANYRPGESTDRKAGSS